MAESRAADTVTYLVMDEIRAIAWRERRLRLLDQRKLPFEESYLECETAEQVARAIRDMVVRGAPAIGIAAAYGVVLAAQDAWQRERTRWRAAVEAALAQLRGARPTAVNLGWAIERMAASLADVESDPAPGLLSVARAIHEEDLAANRRMGEAGAAYLEPGCEVITHCNTGALATGGYGTALGVIRSAWAGGRLARVYACETRPWLQGARLTLWELERSGIPATLIADGAAAALMRARRIAWVIVGADRVAANGDTANKIGTYALALAARAHGVRFMVVAPTSSIDGSARDGSAIHLEERPAQELLRVGETPIAPPATPVWNPVFDITPAALIDLIVTEKGVVERPGMKKGTEGKMGTDLFSGEPAGSVARGSGAGK
jgi:methylthioribose-1-phosphate isomerase